MATGTEVTEEEKLPPPKPQDPLYMFSVDPDYAKGQPNWRSNLLSDYDITTHSVGTFYYFTGRCTKSVAEKVSLDGRCSVRGVRDDQIT